jgi:hypothetical protein
LEKFQNLIYVLIVYTRMHIRKSVIYFSAAFMLVLLVIFLLTKKENFGTKGAVFTQLNSNDPELVYLAV